jgi:hypothetical protein
MRHRITQSVLKRADRLPMVEEPMKNLNNGAQTALAVVVMAGVLAPGFAAGQQPVGLWDWSRVQRVESGTAIALSVHGNAPLRYRMAFADDSNLFVLGFRNADATLRVRQALALVGRDWPLVLDGKKLYTFDSVMVSQNGVFDGGRKVADLLAVAKDNVWQIRATEGNRGVGMIVGAVVGGALGIALLVGGGCDRGTCAEGAVGLASLFGAAGAAVGYLVTSQGVGSLIYQAPPPAPALDEASWQRIRRALPPSLRGRTR